MNGMNKCAMSLIVVAALCAATAAAAQSPSISVKNQTRPGSRRVEIIIQDPIVVGENGTAAAGATTETFTPPDGGQIQGTMLSGGKAYAITATKMLGVGDSILGHRITEITLDRVVVAQGAHSYALDPATGEWTAAAIEANVAE